MAKPFQPAFDLDEPLPAPASNRKALLDQIKRDVAVLQEDPIYHVPSREFYEGRIASYRQSLTQ